MFSCCRSSLTESLPEAEGANEPQSIAKLLFSAARGDVEGVKRLVATGTNVNAVDYDKRCALHLAAAEGHHQLVSYLIGAKADVGIKDRWGHTAIDEAVRSGSAEVRQLLLDVAGVADGSPVDSAMLGSIAHHEADSMHAQIQAATALCCAAAAGELALVQELMDGGADLNAGDYDGRRALHVASAHGHAELVEWLIQHKADVNVEDNFGLTPLREAMIHHNAAIVGMLTKVGAESHELMEVRIQAETGAWAIPLSEVKMGGVLSKTLKSVIYRATWRGTQVVCKTTPKLKLSMTGTTIVEGGLTAVGSQVGAASPDEAATGEEELIHELRLLATLRHPDLVMFLGACIDHTPPLVISEFMEGGDLERYYMAQAKKAGTFYKPPIPTLLKWASAVARALAFLHGCPRPVIHRDLKPLNLLLNRSNEVKVTDFGISKLLAPRQPSEGLGSVDGPAKMSGGVGTWRYMAPEVVRYENYNDRCDIYSYSLIMWFMCTGRQPFVDEFGKDAEVVLKAYLKGSEPRPDPNIMKCPKGYRELTKECWDITPAKRPSAQECAQRLAALLV